MATQSIDHLVWFRNDLRVHDNQALVAACKNAAVDGGSVGGNGSNIISHLAE